MQRLARLLLKPLRRLAKRFIRLIVVALTRYPALHRTVKRAYRALPGFQRTGRRLALASLPPSQARTTNADGSARKPDYVFVEAPVGPDGVVTVEALYHLSRSLRVP